MHIFAGSGAERAQVKVDQLSVTIRPIIHPFCDFRKGGCKCGCVVCADMRARREGRIK